MTYAPMKVEYVDHMGTDLSIVNAARVSFGKMKDGDDIDEKDIKLIKYLADHDHWSPFAHAFMSLRIKAPIFVARQLVKHQIGLSGNEISRRYVSDEPEFYFPDGWRAAPTTGAKQGSSDGGALNQKLHDAQLDVLVDTAEKTYRAMVVGNVAPEMARMVLPQNMMTEWIWSGSLFAFARVCNLRLDPHAQAETSEIARKISNECGFFFPASWGALVPDGV